MRVRSFSSLVAAVAVSLSIFGCSSTDSPIAPKRSVAPVESSSHTLLGTPKNVIPLLRNTALSSPITVTKTIGILGGTLSIPSAGVVVVVPPLALTSNHTLSITARAGSEVGYDFAPHGLTFNLPLVMTQNLTGTQAQSGGLINPLSLFVGYYADSTNTHSITELLGVSLTVQNTLAITTLWHFSGYLYAGGCEEDGGGQ